MEHPDQSGQVDPEFEQFYHMDTYTGMGNSPVVNVDPNGKTIGFSNLTGQVKEVVKSAYIKSKTFRELYNFARSNTKYRAVINEAKPAESKKDSKGRNGSTSYQKDPEFKDGAHLIQMDIFQNGLNEKTIAHELHHAVMAMLANIENVEQWKHWYRMLTEKQVLAIVCVI